jgi:CheY-like chemotaxis protein
LQLLLQHDGYDVMTASSGREAIEQVAAQPPDLILMDVMMPELSGYDVTRMLKEDSASSHIPVVMLSAKTAYNDMEQGWEAGTDLYLEKPITAAALKDRYAVRFPSACLRRKGPAPAIARTQSPIHLI